MSTLIITLPPPPARPAAGEPGVRVPSGSTEVQYAVSQGDQTPSQHGSAALALLPRPARGYAEVVVVVPVQALSWQQVSLPKGALASGAARLRAVLDGLLEERVLDDVDKLHFALQPAPQADTPVWVAVCDKAWLQAHLQALEAAQWPVARIVPELAPATAWLQETESSAQQRQAAVQVLGTLDQPLLASTDADGVSLLPLTAANLALCLGEPSDAAQALLVLAEPALAAQVEMLLQRKVTLQQSATRYALAAQSPWDLAQFDLVSNQRSRAFKGLASLARDLLHAPVWRAARLGLLALLLVHLVGLNAFAWRENAALDAKRNAVRGVLTESFPAVKVVLDAPLQMTREVARLQQSAGALAHSDLEAILMNLSAVAQPGKSLTAIEYVADSVRLKGFQLTAVEADQLMAQGYAASTEGDTLVIKPALRKAVP